VQLRATVIVIGMATWDRDQTDLGLSADLTPEQLADAARTARAHRLGLIAADVPTGPPASAETRARIIARTAAENGWSARRPTRRVRGRCRQCAAEPGQWCRRTTRASRQLGFVHPDRDTD
jgi:hypothetical protein